MSICDHCLHDYVCGLEGNHEEALIHCVHLVTERREGPLINGTRHCGCCGRLFNDLEQQYFNYCPNCGMKIIKED